MCMCGIIGFNWEDKNLLRKGLSKIKHRGPDSEGKFFDKSLSLGHRRLSILDLSRSGKQPMSNKEDSIWITYNGEVYNFPELKEELKEYDFKSETDTEVLIYLYQKYGVKMLDKLKGIFAFCIYDTKKNILFLARDHVGVKPLYYYNKKGKFMFCSELKGILEYEGIKREINRESLFYFSIFKANISEDAMISEVKKLKPGHFMIYDLKKNKLEVEKYWELKFEQGNEEFSYYSKKLEEEMKKVVDSQMISDVPFGAYLSGGIDSGTVVSLMTMYSDKPINTFTVGFEEEIDGECDAAKELSNNLGTDHHELRIGKKDIKYLPEVVYYGDEPMADATSIPTFLLSKFARKKCKVILTGEGADELFGGYPQYKFMRLNDKLIKKFPKFSRKVGFDVFNKLPDKILDKGFKFSSSLGEKGKERLLKFLLAERLSEKFLNQDTIFNQEEAETLTSIKKDIYQEIQKKYFLSNVNAIDACQKMEFESVMVDRLLMKVDKNTMAHGVEGRVPFLDQRIIELARRIPEKYRFKNIIKGKYILRQSMKNIVPKNTLQRKKRHFFVPIDRWINQDLKNLQEDLLSEKFIKRQDLFNFEEIKKMFEGIGKSRLYYSRQIWSLINFQIWYKQYIENEKVKI